MTPLRRIEGARAGGEEEQKFTLFLDAYECAFKLNHFELLVMAVRHGGLSNTIDHDDV